jgi:hypothetical protein
MSIHKTKKIVVTLTNRPGSLAELTSNLAKSNVNIEAMTIDETEEGNTACFFVFDNNEKAKEIISSLRDNFFEREVICVDCSDKVGEVARIAKLLGDAGINIDKMFTGVPTSSSKFPLYIEVRGHDIDKVIDILK